MTVSCCTFAGAAVAGNASTTVKTMKIDVARAEPPAMEFILISYSPFVALF
jgi:hypothetical protein